tara:strand:+ start:94 stop:315 length:222 start_codon:yes stop_codon:yes gene_type:complete
MKNNDVTLHFHPFSSKVNSSSPLHLLNLAQSRLARVEKKWLCENGTKPQFYGKKVSIECKPKSQETVLGELRY